MYIHITICFYETVSLTSLFPVVQVIGLPLSQTLDDLALLYLATVQALAVSYLFSALVCPQLQTSKPSSTIKGYLRLLVPFCLSLWMQLGTLHILEAMKQAGHDIKMLFMCGGLSKNSLFVQIHANATGMRQQLLITTI